MSSQVNAIFDIVPYRSPKVSTFDAKHDILTDFTLGKVNPLDCVPVYPKDSFNFRYKCQGKFNPLVAPAFQRMFVKQWSFYIRNCDLWDDFNEFYTGNNPRKGKTAYLPDNTPPSHPHFKLNGVTQFGNSYLGARLNLTNINIDAVKYAPNSGQYIVPKSVVADCIRQVYLAAKDSIHVNYEDGNIVRRLFPYQTSKLASIENTRNLYYTLAESSPVDGDLCFNYVGVVDDADMTSNVVRLDDVPFNERSLPSLFAPHHVCDYLGFPTFDFKHFFNTEFKDSLNEHRERYGDLALWCQQYFYDYTKIGALSLFGFGYDASMSDDDVIAKAQRDTFYSALQHDDYELQNYKPVPYYDCDSGDIVYPPHGSDIRNSSTYSNITLYEVVVSYILWCKFKGVNTTMLSYCPYFSIYYLRESFLYSDKKVDSLRLRGYHKVYNDYFRRPDLTAEIPIPFSDGGDDLLNYYRAVMTYLTLSYDGEHLLDWNRNDVLDDDAYSVYLYNYVPFTKLVSKQLYSTDAIYRSKLIGLLTWKLLTTNFNHLRQRDYLTSALPDTGVVDVVAPVNGTEHLDDYSKPPYSNNQFDEDGNFDKTDINPTPASQITQAIGWLDLENLRITQTLKRYFTTLRHTLQGVKDYIKCYFDVEIDDLSVHRALWLGGNEQIVHISELSSSSETDVASLGKLGGKADFYSESGTINHFVKECGFILTLHCLSPIQSNVGGLNRELIRDNKFDYFLPDFAELGDQRLDQVEVTCAPTILNDDGDDKYFDYDKLYGYTQRYLHLKFMSNQVHGDFLGSASDWHLDLLRPAVATDNVDLTQANLSETSDDRIFTDVYEDESNIRIWCTCEGTYQRALPVQQFEVLA